MELKKPSTNKKKTVTFAEGVKTESNHVLVIRKSLDTSTEIKNPPINNPVILHENKSETLHREKESSRTLNNIIKKTPDNNPNIEINKSNKSEKIIIKDLNNKTGKYSFIIVGVIIVIFITLIFLPIKENIFVEDSQIII